MGIDRGAVRAVVFDYGNTLIPFGDAELEAYGRSLAAALERRYGPLDLERFFALRAVSRFAPYIGDPPTYRENDLAAITVRLVRELYGRDPSQGELDDLLRVRFDSFVGVVRAPDYATDLLGRLGRRFPLGLLSNYPDARAIRASVDTLGWTAFFRSVVVSGDLGYVKPHPITFATVLQELGLKAREVVFVGDNWLADVQGAKRVGMQMVHMRQWIPPERFEPQDGDHAPDAIIGHLSELEAVLAG